MPFIGDYDGDGKDDLLVWYPTNGNWQVALSKTVEFVPTPGGGGSSWLENWARGSGWVPFVGNFSGGAQDDIVVWHPANGDWQVAVSDGTKFTPVGGSWLLNWATGSGWVPLVGDFNGDGMDDIVVWHPANGDWQVAVSDGTKFNPLGGSWLLNWATGSGWIPLVGDFDGDGKDDIVVWHPENGDWQVAVSDATKFTPVGGSWLLNWATGPGWIPLVGDFDGDGKDDIVVWHPENGDWQVAVSDGTKFIPVGGSWLFNWPQGSGWIPFVGDFNGDGKDDIVVWHPERGDWQVALSAGNRFVTRKPQSLLARRPGFSDLYIVRDEWARYEPGELAHIENVMASEVRERSHTRLTENEETFTTDQERSKLDERDTQSTDRFDLHTETSRDSSLNVGVDGSVDTSGQYGPTSVSTHLGGNLDYSLNESQSQATTTAHEVVSRAVLRVEEKVRQVRTTRSLSRIEEVNKHAFTNNKENAKHIVGVYRWVDKIKWVQIFRYPNRFLLEFQIPEPGAWLRWLLDNKKPPVVSENPAPLKIEIKDPNTNEPKLVDLTPAQITSDNYLVVAGRYKTLGLIPPPKSVLITASYAKDTKSPRDTETIVKDDEVNFVKLEGVAIPAGYVATSWQAFLYGWGEEAHKREASAAFTIPAGIPVPPAVFVPARPENAVASVHITVGNSNVFFEDDITQGFMKKFDPQPVIQNPVEAERTEPGTLPVSVRLHNIRGYYLHITFVCDPSKNEFMKWQIGTYEAIANAYYAMKRIYDEEVAARNIRDGVNIKGQSPLQNAEMARAEVKKAVIEMLTGEDFSGRNGIQRRDGSGKPIPPEIILDKAVQTAPEIQFIEQAFEWENMTYVLYPYFWTDKDQWNQLADLNSEDPDFARFLRAGSARVIVPARPGFEWQSWLYVYAGIMWGGGPAPGPEDHGYLSVAAEIEAQQKAPRDGVRGESWPVRLPTTLVWLDNANSTLPIEKAVHELDPPPEVEI